LFLFVISEPVIAAVLALLGVVAWPTSWWWRGASCVASLADRPGRADNTTTMG
jgi:hypothetical protein